MKPQTKVKPHPITYKTYTFQPKGKLAKLVAEDLQRQKQLKDSQRADLRDIAIYLEGMFKAQGNISPLGHNHIRSLWSVIATLK